MGVGGAFSFASRFFLAGAFQDGVLTAFWGLVYFWV